MTFFNARRTNYVLILFFCLTPLLVSQESHQLTLDEAVDLALERNEDMRKAEVDQNAAQARIREARAGTLPTISFSAGYTRNFYLPVFFFPDFNNPDKNTAIPVGSDNSYTSSINVTQPLFRAGKLGNATRIAKMYKEFSNEAFKGTRGDVTLAVHDGYYQVLLAENLLRVNQQLQEQTQEHLEYSRTLFEQGQVSEYDTLRAFVEYVNTQPTVINSENAHIIALYRLKNLIGVDLDDELVLLDSLAYSPKQLPNLEEALARAKNNRPELKQTRLQARMLQQNIGIVRSEILPSLDLVGTWSAQAESNEWDFGEFGFVKSLSAGVNLHIPIFDGFKTYAQIDQARADYRNALYDAQKLEDDVEVEIKSLLNSATEAEKSIWAQQSNLKQARRALELAQIRYREGQAKALDLEDAQLALRQAQSNYYQVLATYNMVKVRLDRAIGAL